MHSSILEVESEIEPDHIHTGIAATEAAVGHVLDPQRQRHGVACTKSHTDGGRRGEMKIAAMSRPLNEEPPSTVGLIPSSTNSELLRIGRRQTGPKETNSLFSWEVEIVPTASSKCCARMRRGGRILKATANCHVSA